MRRRVDLRWRIKREELKRLVATQSELLHHASQALKPGGTIVYSTCSLEPAENRGVVIKFLETHPEFTLEADQQLLPFTHQVDGAYWAKLVKAG